MFPFLVADIGGTNARFALVVDKNAGEFVFENIQILSTQAHDTFESSLQTYLNTASAAPTAACIGIAGPVNGDHIKMTNLSWEFTGLELCKRFGFSRTLLMNDFAAVAAACANISPDYLVTVKPGQGVKNGHKVVFGPGTGLGVAGLVNNNGQWLPVPCEGGHVNIAPSTPYETDIIKLAMADLGHVSAESLVSGPGLVNLYKAVCAVEGNQFQAYKPSDITYKALNAEDPMCIKSLDLFVSFAGSFAGNLALTYGAKGGVYIAGGIIPRILPYLQAGAFIDRFCAKGPMSHYVKTIPVELMTHPETAFVGAATWLEQHLSS